MNKQQLDEYNKAQGNLPLKDTETLLEVANLIEENDYNEAYSVLMEYVAERGYDENPPVRNTNG